MVRDQGVCIRQWDWSETSQTVSIFGRETGVIRAVAKGSKRENAKFSGGVEVMTRGELLASIKGGDAMALLTAWDLAETFPAARLNLRSFYAGHLMLDLVHHAVHDSDPHPALFDALLAALRRLGDAQQERAALVWFLWQTLAETGHAPELGQDVRTGTALESAATYAFSPRLGGVTRDGAAEGAINGPVWRVRAETVELLRRVRVSAAPQDGDAPEAAARAARMLAMYFREVFSCDPPTLKWLLEELREKAPSG